MTGVDNAFVCFGTRFSSRSEQATVGLYALGVSSLFREACSRNAESRRPHTPRLVITAE